jgi:hypothetical protein
MTGPTEEQIRTRAYELWKQAGQPYGQMDTLWYQAEKELLRENGKNGANGEAPPELNGHRKAAQLQ